MQHASRWAVFGLFFFFGVCALIYQITWGRLFRLAMGNTVFTSATVLTAFMAGLALGSWVAGRLADRTGRPLRAYAYLEVFIGLCGPSHDAGLQCLRAGLRSMAGSITD